MNSLYENVSDKFPKDFQNASISFPNTGKKRYNIFSNPILYAKF